MEKTQIRILCLHGWGANPEIMEYGMRNFKQYFPEMAFSYLQGYVEVPLNMISD